MASDFTLLNLSKIVLSTLNILFAINSQIAMNSSSGLRSTGGSRVLAGRKGNPVCSCFKTVNLGKAP